MKSIVFITLMLFAFIVSNSQTENFNSDFIIKFGFNLGVNYSNLYTRDKLPENASISNGMGFRLGIVMDYKISKHLVFSPKSELSFNRSKVVVVNANSSEIFPSSLDFITHIVYRRGTEQCMPYIFCGPDIKFLVKQKRAIQSYYDFAIDFGIGIDKKVQYFVFAPELRYSYGLLNVNQNPELQSLFFHNVALVLNFK